MRRAARRVGHAVFKPFRTPGRSAFPAAVLFAFSACGGAAPVSESALNAASARNVVVVVESQIGRATGIVMDKSGLLMTLYTVAEGDGPLKVRLADNSVHPAIRVGLDRDAGLALLKVDVAGLRTADAVPLKDLARGQQVFWIEDPARPATENQEGEIAAVHQRQSERREDVSYIQIKPRRSVQGGGVLFDTRGRVLGLNSALYVGADGSLNVFAIPIETLQSLAQEFRTTRRLVHGWIGLEARDVNLKLAAALNFNRARGAIVVALHAGGPAERAGIVRGDIVLDYAGKTVERAEDLSGLIRQSSPGTRVPVIVWRRDGTRTLYVAPQEAP